MSVDMSKHFSTSALIKFTLPTIAMMIFTSCYTIVDGFFVSNYAGKTALAAVNLILPPVMMLASFGMKPNFVIAAYCLAIILIRPTLAQSAVIGLIAGLVCQIPMLNATPLLNIPSELLGAVACGLLIRVPMKIGGKFDANPLVNTFISTCVSGFTFAALSVYINVVSVGGSFAVAMAAYVAIVLGTATFNAIFVQILATPLAKVLKR